jgi:hypothetical protein
MTVMILDLPPPTDEIRRLCVCVAGNRTEVGRLVQAFL